jgi:hypothetical protein
MNRPLHMCTHGCVIAFCQAWHHISMEELSYLNPPAAIKCRAPPWVSIAVARLHHERSVTSWTLRHGCRSHLTAIFDRDLIGTAHSVYEECPYWWLEWAVPIRFGCEMRTSAAARHGDDVAVARRIQHEELSCVQGLAVWPLLWQQVSHVDALPRVYYFYLC